MCKRIFIILSVAVGFLGSGCDKDIPKCKECAASLLVEGHEDSLMSFNISNELRFLRDSIIRIIPLGDQLGIACNPYAIE